MEQKRPIGVIILGCLSVFVGCIGLIFILPIFNELRLLLWFPVLWSILMIIVGIGLLMVKKWARIIYFLMLGFRWLHYIGTIIYHFISKTPFPPKYQPGISTLFYIIITVLIIYYLTRPKVKEQFH